LVIRRFVLLFAVTGGLAPTLAAAQLSPTDQIRANELNLVLQQQQQQIDAIREQQRTDQQNLQSQLNIAILKAQGEQPLVNPGLLPAQPSPYLSYSRPLAAKPGTEPPKPEPEAKPAKPCPPAKGASTKAKAACRAAKPLAAPAAP